MMLDVTITSSEFDLFRRMIEQECGIEIGDDKTYLIESRLSKLLIENDCERYETLYHKAKLNPVLLNKIIDTITTNETLWFRDSSPYLALEEKIFPEWIQKLRSGARSDIRIWSAACSTGQEPYSISIMAHETARKGKGSELVKGSLRILASDISTTALALAKNARYDPLSISRGMPEELKRNYFEESGRVFCLKDDIKKMIDFQQVNLFKSFSHLGQFDLIMLRNVAIYFSKEFKIDLFKRLAQSLKPDGYLFLGASESLFGYSEDFERLQHGSAQFYKVKPGVGRSTL